MIGYYDPTTLTQKGDAATIAFINATDGSDIRTINIDSAEKARFVKQALKDQSELGISSDRHPMRKVGGMAHRIPMFNNEFVIIKNGQRVPVRLGFKADEDAILKKSIALVVGEYVDGAIMAAHVHQEPFVIPKPALPQDPGSFEN